MPLMPASPPTRVLVIGSSGMLGSMIARVLSANPNIEVTRAARVGGGDVLGFDASTDRVEDLLAAAPCDWIVNAIGVLASRIDESDPASVADAREVNGVFPHRLVSAIRPGQRIVSIATDGVFSGAAGPYDEDAPHDATDAYALSKSEGEVPDPAVLNLRCSIVGPERRQPSSLLGWVLSQPSGGRIEGWDNHFWNGVTTLHFARLVEALAAGKINGLPSLLHVVPADALSKAGLLDAILAAFGRSDVEVSHSRAERRADRRLATRYPRENRRLWAATGYDEPPTITRMLEELATAMG